MSKVLVIGCVSADTIHLELDGSTVRTLGGAGLYTALAARAAGAECTLLSPRTDESVSAFSTVSEHLNWIGPQVEENEMPSLEIVHHGNDKATLKSASWGGELQLTPDLLPADLDQFCFVHIAALSSAAKQLEFATAVRKHSREVRLSAGTYARIATNESDVVKELMEKCDLFFMNENEANILFGGTRDLAAPSFPQYRFITKGRRGATLFTQNGSMEVSAHPVEEVDPTGAGDVFCGTVLGALSQQSTLARSMTLAMERSATVVTKHGPEAIVTLFNA